MELVSVIIPTYNGTRYIMSAVQSVLDQTYAAYEIIVIDDGSTDNICSVLAPVFEKIVYIRQDNSGVGAARNLGLKNARGKYIAFLDDDDTWLPTKIESQVKILMDNPQYAIVYSYPTLIDEDGEEIPNDRPFMFPSGDVYLDFLLKNRINTPSVTLVRKSVFEEIGLFNGSFCEDYDLWLRIARQHAVVYCPEIQACYRVRRGSASRNYEKMLASHLAVLEAHLNYYDPPNKHLREQVIAAINENKRETYRTYAYCFYCELGNLKQARSCLLESLKIRVTGVKDVFYLLLFSLPRPVFESLRCLKRCFSETKRNLRSRQGTFAACGAGMPSRSSPETKETPQHIISVEDETGPNNFPF